MRSSRSCTLLLLFLLPLHVFAGSRLSPQQIDTMFRAATRQTFRWKLAVSKPLLTFQQLYVVKVEADVDPAKFPEHKRPHAFEFFVRIGDGQGHWLPASDFASIEIPEDFSTKQDLQFISAVYLRPGTYDVAVVLADTTSGAWNSGRTTLQVRSPGRNIESIGSNAPSAEFLRNIQLAQERSVGSGGEQRTTYGGGNNALWHFGHTVPEMVVNTTHQVVLDFLLVMRTDEDAGQYRGTPLGARRSIGRTLQIGSLLARLHPSKGCTRLTALDIMRQELLLDRVPAATTDLDALEASLTPQERNSVQLAKLERRHMAMSEFAETVDRLRTDKPECGGPDAERVLVIVGDPLTFPSGTMRPQPFTARTGRVFYIRNFYGEWDDIEHLLKPLNAKRYDFQDPLSFRHAFHQLLAELRK